MAFGGCNTHTQSLSLTHTHVSIDPAFLGVRPRTNAHAVAPVTSSKACDLSEAVVSLPNFLRKKKSERAEKAL